MRGSNLSSKNGRPDKGGQREGTCACQAALLRAGFGAVDIFGNLGDSCLACAEGACHWRLAGGGRGGRVRDDQGDYGAAPSLAGWREVVEALRVARVMERPPARNGWGVLSEFFWRGTDSCAGARGAFFATAKRYLEGRRGHGMEHCAEVDTARAVNMRGGAPGLGRKVMLHIGPVDKGGTGLKFIDVRSDGSVLPPAKGRGGSGGAAGQGARRHGGAAFAADGKSRRNATVVTGFARGGWRVTMEMKVLMFARHYAQWRVGTVGKVHFNAPNLPPLGAYWPFHRGCAHPILRGYRNKERRKGAEYEKEHPGRQFSKYAALRLAIKQLYDAGLLERREREVWKRNNGFYKGRRLQRYEYCITHEGYKAAVRIEMALRALDWRAENESGR